MAEYFSRARFPARRTWRHGVVDDKKYSLFAIACAPILTEWIAAKANHFPHGNASTNASSISPPKPMVLLPTITVLFAVGFFAFNHTQGKQIYNFNPQVFPIRAADWLEENPVEGNMFNEFNWGGYLLYRLWPASSCSWTAKATSTAKPLMRNYETMMLAKNNWKSLLEKYQIDWAIIPTDSPLAVQLKQET
ncbi:MAG: hypothetical protein U0X87_04885 [Anaerolineales bacterium]